MRHAIAGLRGATRTRRYSAERFGRSERGDRGTGTVELVIALTVILVALLAFLSTSTEASHLHRETQERRLAHRAAVSWIERLRGEDFASVYALYNSNPDDDPDGPGTAPGPDVDVAGLGTSDGAPVGHIVFPEGTLADGSVGLREDVAGIAFGMSAPVDLDGDGLVAGALTGPYVLLPVRIIFQWQGRLGPESYVIPAILGRKS